MPSRAEIWQALYGAWRFARFDRNAIHYFDLSHRGVWRSFWAAALSYPGFLLLRWLELDDQTLADSSIGHIFLVETIGDIVGWCAFPLVVLGLCRWLGREDRGFDFIAAYNWSVVLQVAFFIVVGLVSLALPAGMALGLGRIALIAMLVYEWFIALVAIGAGGAIAGVIVVIDVVLSTFIVLVTESLY
ncbi:MAG TPA: hypothetical protein VGP48_13495 [Stellaceae bacterium]|jgi:hypothetical protein|nr:hypothetical protein [Stellaceae bacterium]